MSDPSLFDEPLLMVPCPMCNAEMRADRHLCLNCQNTPLPAIPTALRRDVRRYLEALHKLMANDYGLTERQRARVLEHLAEEFALSADLFRLIDWLEDWTE